MAQVSDPRRREDAEWYELAQADGTTVRGLLLPWGDPAFQAFSRALVVTIPEADRPRVVAAAVIQWLLLDLEGIDFGEEHPVYSEEVRDGMCLTEAGVRLGGLFGSALVARHQQAQEQGPDRGDIDPASN